MQAEFNQAKLVKNLPDAYKKTPDSNNAKILEVERIACEDLRDALMSIDNILDVNNATGKTLELYGERVGQAKGQADDEKYLFLIKAKIMRNRTDGSYPSVVNALCQTYNCDPSQVFIVDGEDPCTVDILTMPLAIINKAGFSTNQTLAIVKSLLPIGTTISSFMFEGTFQFSDVENEYDENRGFSDVEGGTIGGFFGVTSGDENDVILPI